MGTPSGLPHSLKLQSISINSSQPQPPLLHLLSSLLVPIEQGVFSFSLASFHASFVSDGEVIILDVQDSKLLLQEEKGRYWQGYFSPDGYFFASGTLGQVCVWQNTPTGYVPQCSLRPQLPFYQFSWSPASTSILCWGPEGIQLLYPNNFFSPKEVDPLVYSECHLVAYSADRKYIATAKWQTTIITALSCPLGTLLQFTTDIQIQDVKIIDHTIFAVGMNKLVSWNLGPGGVMHSSQTLAISHGVFHLTLSHDCSWIAFSRYQDLSLYNVKTQKTISKDTGHPVHGIQFSPNGCKVWYGCFREANDPYFGVLEIAEDWSSVAVAQGGLEDGKLLFNLCSHGYNFEMGSKWIVDSRGKKLFWLPPNWRKSQWQYIRWDNNFLALIHYDHPKPIIIEFLL